MQEHPMVLRVFQFASGTVGRHVMKAVLARSDLDLVGLHVTSADKVGRDIGEIAGDRSTGIAATAEVELILQSDADVVIHAPLPSMVYGDDPLRDLDDICRLLSGGKNVITVAGYLYPRAHGDEVLNRLTDACRRGGARFHSTGLNPGWMGDLVPLLMSALSRRIDQIHVLEISNFQHYPSPEIMFGSMGFGSSPAEFAARNTRRSEWLNSLFRESIWMVAEGLGATPERVESVMETALAPGDLQTAAGTVRAGTIAGQHWTWSGMIGGTARIVHETVWRMHETVAPEWATGRHRVSIRGEPDMHIDFDANHVSDGLQATAMHAVNAIVPLCAREPGIHTLLDMPWITGRGTLSL
jgi:4-hydroxy-tetrahydrodipicolinate reductase